MPTAPTVQFLGAAGTVTGSKHLVRHRGDAILLDCGPFQGQKHLRQRNWAAPAFDPAALDAMVISHAHIDHVGYLPLAVRRGFRGPVFCTAATADLLRISLPDSAYLQEEQAADANRDRYSKHDPALPLYAMEDAMAAPAFAIGRTRSWCGASGRWRTTVGSPPSPSTSTAQWRSTSPRSTGATPMSTTRTPRASWKRAVIPCTRASSI